MYPNIKNILEQSRFSAYMLENIFYVSVHKYSLETFKHVIIFSLLNLSIFCIFFKFKFSKFCNTDFSQSNIFTGLHQLKSKYSPCHVYKMAKTRLIYTRCLPHSGEYHQHAHTNDFNCYNFNIYHNVIKHTDRQSARQSFTQMYKMKNNSLNVVN